MDAEKVKRVAVIGAGTMGHSIAQVFAACEIEVNLADVKKEILDNALRLIKGNLQTLVEYGKVREKDVSSALARIHTTTDIQAAARGADFVLEAVVEIFTAVEQVFLDKVIMVVQRSRRSAWASAWTTASTCSSASSTRCTISGGR